MVRQPIVLLHGTGANAFIWETTSLFLASHGYYVIAVDLPPFGWSEIPTNPQDYKKETQAKKVALALEALSIKNPSILGHSYNSKVASLVATQYPSRELILVAPVFEYGTKPNPGMIGTLTSISIIRDPLLSLFVNNTLLAKKVLLSFMYKKDVDVSSTLSKTVLPFNKPDVNHAYGEWFQEFFNETSDVLDSDTLSQLQIPVHVLWGDMDTIAPIENFKKLMWTQKISYKKR
jgi:pimeloyl-ACP methyl ester carboxylesterase